VQTKTHRPKPSRYPYKEWRVSRVVAGAPNGRNQYDSVAGDTLTYADKRNLTAFKGDTYGYDAVNRLTSSSVNAVHLSYDGADRLHEITVSGGASRRFLYDGAALIAEYDEANTLLRRYVHGPGSDDPIVCVNEAQPCTERTDTGSGDKFWLLSDERGSVLASGKPGAVQSRYLFFIDICTVVI